VRFFPELAHAFHAARAQGCVSYGATLRQNRPRQVAGYGCPKRGSLRTLRIQ
jgi:hypothetical protein